MFSSLLFKKIACPIGVEKCKLTNCLYSHERSVRPSAIETSPVTTAAASVGRENGDLKRRRLNDSSIERTPAVSEADDSNDDSWIKNTVTPSSSASLPSAPQAPTINSDTKPLSLSSTRSISPPPTKAASAKPQKPSSNGSNTQAPAKQPLKVEQLTPRMVKSGGPFQQRLQFLKALHAEFKRLNDAVKTSKDASISKLQKSDQEIITLALDKEEEANAKGAGLYRSLVTQKLAYYKKMLLQGWVLELRSISEKENKAANGANPSSEPIKVETGLTTSEELDMLERFVLSPHQMSQAGFILTPPTDEQIAEAERTQTALGGYELCDRCGTRFKVLSEPKDGSFTTGGRCVHHWGKAFYPKTSEKNAQINGAGLKEQLYSCCNMPKGSPGCTTQNSHVFKIGANSPGRLAGILQFATTPLNRKAERMAVVFDCEMGYTTAGLEMIRISACKWPSNDALLDVLVKPIGTILDLNTKFSGVTPRQFAEATPFDPKDDTTPPLPASADGAMTIVDSPAKARDLLTKYISPTTVLIGHAIDNDLNVLRLLHPTIVDTSLLFPHFQGVPYRFSLRKLAKDFLNLDIQTSSAAGHDSMEDSRATGQLVRVKVQREAEKYRRMGWEVRGGKWFAPVSKGEKEVRALPPYTDNMGTGRKRKNEAPFAVGAYVSEPVKLTELIRERDTKL